MDKCRQVDSRESTLASWYTFKDCVSSVIASEGLIVSSLPELCPGEWFLRCVRPELRPQLRVDR